MARTGQYGGTDGPMSLVTPLPNASVLDESMKSCRGLSPGELVQPSVMPLVNSAHRRNPKKQHGGLVEQLVMAIQDTTSLACIRQVSWDWHSDRKARCEYSRAMASLDALQHPLQKPL